MSLSGSEFEEKESHSSGIGSAVLILILLIAAAFYLYVAYNDHRAHEPIEIVKKHFVFYPEYSHGAWHEGQCVNADQKKCREVTYTIPVKGCGPITFDWQIFPEEDADAAWSYDGTNPKIDENRYPLYAVLNADSRLIDSPALGRTPPEVCQSK